MAIDKFRQADITLDKANGYISADNFGVEGDYNGRELLVQITNNGVVEDQRGLKLNLGWFNAGAKNNGLNSFSEVDASQGLYKVRFDKEMMNAGNVSATIQIIDDASVIYSKPFAIKIGDNPIKADIVIASDSFTALNEALLAVNNINETASARLEQFFNELKEYWQTYVDGITDIITSIDPGGTLLNEIVLAQADENGKQYASLSDRLNAKKFAFDSADDIGGDTVSPALTTFINTINPDNLNIAVITDSHYQNVYGGAKDYPYGDLSLTHLANFMAVANNTDLAIALGDNTDGNNAEKNRTYGDLSLYADRLLYTPVKGDVAIIAGNHDDGSPAVYNLNKPTTATIDFLREKDLKKIFHTNEPLFDETRDGDSLYFFKDYANKKVRVITLWSEDVPEDEVDEAGVIKYPRWLWHGYRQQQLNWLANTALQNVPDGYHTLIITHTPLDGNGWNDNDASATYVNNDIVAGLINAFINGSYFTQVSASNTAGTGWESTVTADFTAQGARTFIGWFNGHKHKQQHVALNGFDMQMLANDVCLKAEDVGTDKEGTITVISIDPAAKQVKLLGWGRATDYTFNYGGGE